MLRPGMKYLEIFLGTLGILHLSFERASGRSLGYAIVRIFTSTNILYPMLLDSRGCPEKIALIVSGILVENQDAVKF